MIHLEFGQGGPAVRRLQEILECLGFDAGPVDGVFGPSTRRLVEEIQQIEGLSQDGIVGTHTWKRLLARIEESRSMFKVDGNGLHDITGLHDPPKLFGWLRNWDMITGVTLHQTGCEMPQRPMGWGRVNAHYGITQEGLPILINDPRDMLWHAQGLSKTTIGIEIEGNYRGLEANPRTLWEPGGGPHNLNELMMDAAEIIFEDISRQFEAAGQRWGRVYGHRQASHNRRADPGQEIWRRIGLDWSHRLNASHHTPKLQFGKGRPIPKAWDPHGKGAY